jgi:outer membrane immunogenic protein
MDVPADWSVKFEYMYYRLGSNNNNNGTALVNTFTATSGAFTAGAPAWASILRQNGQLDGHILRAGLNYHFNWGAPAPVVARY